MDVQPEKSMRIAIQCSWEPPYQRTFPDGTFVSMNTFDSEARWVVDLSSGPFSRLSQQYPESKRIFVTGEPSGHMGYTPDLIEKFGQYYKGAIFTWHKEMARFPQTKRFKMGSSWVDWKTNPGEKIFGIGGIFSGKANPAFSGYELRKLIVSKQDEITIPGMIFHPGGSWKGISFQYPQPSKRPSLEYMFHLAVENCREAGYFTEKILDCFMTYSVPVYYGDPLIGETFLLDGVIVLDPDRIVAQINGLTSDIYDSKMDAIIENRKRAESFWHFVDNVIGHIKGSLEPQTILEKPK